MKLIVLRECRRLDRLAPKMRRGLESAERVAQCRKYYAREKESELHGGSPESAHGLCAMRKLHLPCIPVNTRRVCPPLLIFWINSKQRRTSHRMPTPREPYASRQPRSATTGRESDTRNRKRRKRWRLQSVTHRKNGFFALRRTGPRAKKAAECGAKWRSNSAGLLCYVWPSIRLYGQSPRVRIAGSIAFYIIRRSIHYTHIWCVRTPGTSPLFAPRQADGSGPVRFDGNHPKLCHVSTRLRNPLEQEHLQTRRSCFDQSCYR